MQRGEGEHTTFCPTPFSSKAINASYRFRPGLLYFSHSIRSDSFTVFCTVLADLTTLSATFDAIMNVVNG